MFGGFTMQEGDGALRGYPGYSANPVSAMRSRRSDSGSPGWLTSPGLPVLFPWVLEDDEMEKIAVSYPSYRMIPLDFVGSRGSVWEAHRFMATHVVLDELLPKTKGVSVLADALYQSATRDLRGITLLRDSANNVDVVSREDFKEIYSVTARSRVRIEKEHGYSLSSAVFRDYVQSADFVPVDRSAVYEHSSEGFAVDITANGISLHEACVEMMRCGSVQGKVFFPATQELLDRGSGEFQDSGGVSFVRDRGLVHMVYPRGETGVPVYKHSSLVSWLHSTLLRVTHEGVTGYFSYLREPGVDGPFGFGSIIRLPDEGAEGLSAQWDSISGVPMRFQFDDYGMDSITEHVDEGSDHFALTPVLSTYFEDPGRVDRMNVLTSSALPSFAEGMSPASPVVPQPLQLGGRVKVIQVVPPSNQPVCQEFWNVPEVKIDKPHGFVNLTDGIYRFVAGTAAVVVVPAAVEVEVNGVCVQAEVDTQVHLMLFDSGAKIRLRSGLPSGTLLWYDTESGIWCPDVGFPLTSGHMETTELKFPFSYSESPDCGHIYECAMHNDRSAVIRLGLKNVGFLGVSEDVPILLLLPKLPVGCKFRFGQVVWEPDGTSRALQLYGRTKYEIVDGSEKSLIGGAPGRFLVTIACGVTVEEGMVKIPGIGSIPKADLKARSRYKAMIRAR